jgi:predicted ArsR family transcriptional regulator
MTNHAKILRDLSISQSTADSIAGRLDLPTEAVQIILQQLIIQQKVTSHQLTKPLTVYRLTAGIPTLTPPIP